MPNGIPPQRFPVLVIAVVVLFAFWKPLFAGATLAPVDQVWRTEPFASEAPVGLQLESAPPDALAHHAAWLARADAWRDGELAFWDHGVAGGAPVMRDGVPFTHLLYLATPGWFAPGLIAAVTMTIAMLGARRLASQRGVSPRAALFAALAYGCSGLFFVWVGWPHATALALVPWLWSAALGAASDGGRRSVVGVAVATGLLLWCGVFALALLALLGAALLVAADGTPGRRRRAVLGIALGWTLAAPHLLAAWEHNEWLEVSSRVPADSSADWITILTVPFASLFGNEAEGLPWLAASTFQASVGFVGVAVVGFAMLGFGRSRAWTGRHRGWALPGLIVLGSALTWFGGPFERALDLVAGDAAIATHARVLVVLPLVLVAADGLDLLVDPHRPRGVVGAAFRGARPGLVIVAILFAVAGWRWLEVAGDAGLARSLVAASTPSILVGLVGVGVVGGWRRGLVDQRAVATIACGLVVFELLTVGMAIPTAGSRTERLHEPEAYAALAELAGPDGRVAGVGLAGAPVVAGAFGLGDVRAPADRPPGVVALFEAADPQSTRQGVGASWRAPVVSDAAAAMSGVWAALGVDVWVAPPTAVPPGLHRDGPVAVSRVDAVLQPLSGAIDVPAGGLRAVTFELSAEATIVVEVEIGVGDALVRNRLTVEPSESGVLVVPVVGEHLPPGPGTVVFRADGEPSIATIGVLGDNSVAAGTIAGDDASELVAVDPMLVVHRPTSSARFATDLHVETTVARAALLVDGRDAGSGSAVVDREVGPVESGATATITVDRDGDRVSARVDATGAGLVIFDVPAAPGWTARVDGRTTEIVVADAAFIGVPVADGGSLVELRYRPPHLVASALLALAGAVALAVIWRRRDLVDAD